MGRYALIIATDVYADIKLAKLNTPTADARAMAEVLADKNLGGFDEVLLCINEKESDVRRVIAEFLVDKKLDDLVLIYFSGHGIQDHIGHLHLALKDTNSRIISATAIPSFFVTQQLDYCRSKKQILILDCCHSGAFAIGGLKLGEDKAVTKRTFEGEGDGRVVLTASDTTQFALEGDQVLGQTEFSLFTHYLLEGIKTGEADQDNDGNVSLNEWYEYTYEQVRSVTNRQTPQKWSYRQRGDLLIAKNPNIRKQTFASVATTQLDKITLHNSIEFMRVPKGSFLMGSNYNYHLYNGLGDENPLRTVDIPYDYWMGRFLVTNELYDTYTSIKEIKHPVEGWKNKSNHPVTYVEWHDIMAYCQFLNIWLKPELPPGLVVRLPTEPEWEKAARGTDGREYPWGNTFDERKCNTHVGSKGKGETTPVGLYSPQGDSPFGCADMSGNLFERTLSLRKDHKYNPKNEWEVTRGARRGGSFYDYNEQFARCSSRFIGISGMIEYFDYNAISGFRLALAPPLPLAITSVPPEEMRMNW